MTRTSYRCPDCGMLFEVKLRDMPMGIKNPGIRE